MTAHDVRFSSASDNGSYPELCLRAAEDDAAFATFRSSPIYQEILEHFSREEGERFLRALEERNADLATELPRFALADRFGGAEVFDYPPYGRLSASTIRYVRHLGNILEYFPSLDGLNIVEIGGGFGGLCSVISTKADVASYTIVDLPEAARLADRWLTATLDADKRSKIHFWDQAESGPSRKWDLLISNFAFTECVPEIQDFYLESIIGHSESGFILFNKRPEAHHPAVLLEKIRRVTDNMAAYEEVPLTSSHNILIVFGHHAGRGPQKALPFPVQRILYRINPGLLSFMKEAKRLIKSALP